MEVCHNCDNPPCARPDHLFLGTTADNARDRVAKGREGHGGVSGTNHHNAVLTPDLVRKIRRQAANGKPVVHIAREMGLGRQAVRSVVVGRTWRHVA